MCLKKAHNFMETFSPDEEKPALTLEQLLAQITEANLHAEWDTGPDVGKEMSNAANSHNHLERRAFVPTSALANAVEFTDEMM
jgi:hypothetical protein